MMSPNKKSRPGKGSLSSKSVLANNSNSTSILPQFQDLLDRTFMPVDVFASAAGDVILCQELPDISGGESYLRIRIRPADAETVCWQILSAAARAREQGDTLAYLRGVAR